MNFRKPKLETKAVGKKALDKTKESITNFGKKVKDVSDKRKEKKKGKSKISKRLSKFKKDNVCASKTGKNKLACQYKNGMISGDAYIRKLRRMTGQKKEKVNTRTYSFKKSKDE